MAQIKKDTTLRKSILQAAITGQLISDIGGESLPLATAGKPSSATPSAGTPRNAPTETGKQLLDRIIEERNKKLLAEWEEVLKKNPKAKKPAPVVASEIDEEEIPFDIPENWCWCRFGEITINRDSERIPLSVSQRELLKKKYDYYGASGIIDKVDNYLFDKDLLLIGEDGANLLTRSTPIAFIASGKYWVNNHAHVIDCNSNYINLNYIKFFINAISLAKYVTGTAQPKMNQEKMNSIPVALPPLAVQNAIVAKLEQVLPLVDAYENALLQKEELKSALPDKVKKAILQEAITGKLTETWRKSATIKESGKQLLDRIIEERNAKALAEWEEALKKNVGGKATLPSFASKTRAKKPVPVVASEIEEEEIPFEVPESWCWCRIDDLFAHNSGKALNKSENKVGTELEYITTSNLYWNYFELDNLKTMLFKDEEIEKCTVKKGDLLVCEGGEVGRSAIWNYDRTVCIQNHIHRLRAYDSKLNVLFYYHVMYLFKESKVIDNYAKGIGIKGLSSNALGSIIVPLPPLEEQEEIVKKMEELLSSIENL